MSMRSSSAMSLTLSFTSILAGCGLADDELGRSPEPTAQLEQVLSGDFVDATGTVTIRIKECGWSATAPHPTATCAVDPDFVLVGGGAQIENQGNALLVASYPDPGLSTWIASSKDHYYHYSHRVRAYAIGLRLAGVSSVTLRSYVRMWSRPSSFASARPEATMEVPPGYKLIGGGAQVTWQGEGILLTDSYPDSFQWVARGKDHIKGDGSGKAIAYAIGVTTDAIPGFGVLDVTMPTPRVEWSGGGYLTASTETPTGWVLSSVGGAVQYDRDGRMLHQLIPFLDNPTNTRPGAMVGSKDHRYWDSGLTTAYALSVKRR
jgi:hypothetical protein